MVIKSYKMITISECDSFNTTEFPGLLDLSPELPVSSETVISVKCAKPKRFAIISGDKTLTCYYGLCFDAVLFGHQFTHSSC